MKTTKRKVYGRLNDGTDIIIIINPTGNDVNDVVDYEIVERDKNRTLNDMHNMLAERDVQEFKDTTEAEILDGVEILCEDDG